MQESVEEPGFRRQRRGGVCWLVWLLLLAAVALHAQTKKESDAIDWRDFDVPPAPVLSPEEALESFRLPPGFRIEVVAAEPLIEDPAMVAWDADGRLWVAEMRGYMHDTEGEGENQGIDRVVVLEDEDGDGRMDRSTVFLDNLVMPRSIAHVEGGVLIAEPPRLWFCQDTDGDLVCDRKTEVSDSYGQRDAVSRTASGLMWNIDNWIYNSRHPVRFRFREGRLISEPDAYRGDWGVSHDDFGRTYANVNSSWLHVDLVPPAYLVRHPNFERPAGIYEKIVRDQSVYSVRVNLGVNQGQSAGMLRPDGRLARTTAATWPCIYRGDQFPGEYSGNAFVPEPAGNVVGRFSLTKGGIRPRAAHELTPDPDWGQRDFLASTDERFRPVQCANGPDGSLYVVDFYRGILEYKLFVTPFLAEQIAARGLDQPLGLGRIYRVVHEAGPRQPVPRLSQFESRELVGALSDSNGWRRDTAQRLLVERGDQSVLKPLRELAAGGGSALGRLHALWTLEGLEEADAPTVLAALRDPHARVRSAAARIGESLAGNSGYLEELIGLADDKAPEVRLQVLLSLGGFSDSAKARRAMMDLVAANLGDALFRHAAISGLAGRELRFLEEWLIRPEAKASAPLLRELAIVLTRNRRPAEVEALLELIAAPECGPALQAALLDGMARAFSKPRPIKLAREPQALGRLRATDSPAVKKQLKRAGRLLAWPGSSAGEAAAETVRPLTAEERKLFERGRLVYLQTCMACHQIHGKGMASLAPPLVNSPWVLGAEERLVRIVLQGIQGPLTVHGKDWNLVMPGLAAHPSMNDENLAAVLTYVRRNWEHTADPVSPGTVSRVRAATSDRVLPWTAEELKNQ